MKIKLPKLKRQRNSTRTVSFTEDASRLLSVKSDFYTREAYKTFRTNVNFALTDEEKSKVLIVTSSFQGEGKSLTAINLAISIAMTEKRVVIVDCDLRRPKLARELRIRSKVGLSNILMEPELLPQALVHTDTANMDAITAGSIPPNPSELLGSNRMSKLLENLKQQYDYVILDTPPVNMVTDAAVLVRESSGLIMVVRAGVAERDEVIQAVEQLEYANAKILGFVLNGVERGSGKYGYGRYGRYGKYGRYGYGRYGYSRKYGYGYEEPDTGAGGGEEA